MPQRGGLFPGHRVGEFEDQAFRKQLGFLEEPWQERIEARGTWQFERYVWVARQQERAAYSVDIASSPRSRAR